MESGRLMEGGRLIEVGLYLMYKRADKQITQHKHNTQGFGERNWAGKSQQGSDRTHRRDNPLDEEPRHKHTSTQVNDQTRKLTTSANLLN